MSDDATSTLVSCPTEFEAETIAAALRAQGITAQVLGGGLTGFRAEAPAMAKVMVLTRDLARAKNSLRAIKAESVDLDWEDVDTGDREAALDAGVLAPSANETGDPGDPGEPGNPNNPRRHRDQNAESARSAIVMFFVLLALCVMAMTLRTPPPIQLSLGCITLCTFVYAVYANSRSRPRSPRRSADDLDGTDPRAPSSTARRPRDDRPPPVYKFPGSR